jgi:hypothetical protein
MSGSQSAEDLIPVRLRLLRRLYEPLLLLNAIRGERANPQSNIEESGPNHRKIRRSFTGHVAYICAYQKGPNHVTAAALEGTPQGTTVWLASNTQVEPKVVNFLEGVLLDLQKVANYNTVEASRPAISRVKEAILTRIITFTTPRLQTYYQMISKSYISICLDMIKSKHEQISKLNFAALIAFALARPLTNAHATIESSGEDDDFELARLHQCLRNHFTDDKVDLQDLVRACQSKRYSQLFNSLQFFTRQGQAHSHEFEQLYKLLCKLGKPVSVSEKMVEAAILLPQDFIQGFQISIVRPSEYQPPPLKGKVTTVQSAAERVFSSQEEKQFVDRLRLLWDEQELSKKLQEHRTTKTRVHAELLLVDHFETYGISLIDGNDKYIGSSKPACFLCHDYIISHPGKFTLSATYHKIDVGWRSPDIASGSPNRQRRYINRDQILGQMIQHIREELRHALESRTQGKPVPADPTAGMPSTIDSHSLDTSTLMRYLSVKDADTPLSKSDWIC